MKSLNIYVWMQTGSYILVMLLLAYAGIKDAKTMLIPNRVHPMLLAAGVLRLFSSGITVHAILWAAAGMVLGGAPLLILAFITKGRCVGGGDIKLAACASFVFGGLWGYAVLCVALILFLLGSLKTKRNVPMPLGPFYAVAGISACVVFVILTFWR